LHPIGLADSGSYLLSKRANMSSLRMVLGASIAVALSAASIKFETGPVTSQPSETGFKDTIEAAIEAGGDGYCSAEVDSLASFSNQVVCGGGNSNIGYKITMEVESPVDGEWEFDFNVDFGWGGVVYFDGEMSPEGYHSDDMWWSGDLNKAISVDITHYFTAGTHTVVAYGAEGCCDGGSNVRFSSPGYAIDYVTVSAMEESSVYPAEIWCAQWRDQGVKESKCEKCQLYKDVICDQTMTGDYRAPSWNKGGAARKKCARKQAKCLDQGYLNPAAQG